MCEYNFLGVFEDKLDDVLMEFCRYKSGITDTEAKVPMFEKIKKIEDYLNNQLADKLVWAKIYTDYKGFEEFGLYKSLPQAFGKLNEEYLYNVLKKRIKDEIVPFPNGEMNFPDITIDNMPMDFKAVKCELTDKSIRIKYNNAIDSVYEVAKRLQAYFYEGIDCDLTDSFLIFTFYDEYEDPGKVRFLHFKIMPTLYCIQLTKDNRFAVKSPGEADADGHHYKIKNSNVCVKIPTVDRLSEDSLTLPTIEEKLLMIREAVSKELHEEALEEARQKKIADIEAFGYPGQ